ncbi:MAG TPA: extracellular solute-binding protein [Alphaproteobacteria bacterium]|jgi:iron(III) transport system substrate-binding protein
MIRGLLTTAAALALTCGLGFASAAGAADLPKATQKAMADLKLDPKLLDGLDAELTVPQAWIDGAKAEKDVIITGTWEPREFSDMTAAFKERYPFINLRYERSGTTGRGMQVLVALGEGRVTADVMTGFGDAIFYFIDMKALGDLRELPGFKNISPDYVAKDGTWISHKLSFRCMAYNTDKVKKADLPKTWDDLVKDTQHWGNGNLALTNNPSTWLLGLWGDKGEKWGSDFTRDLFEKLKPQRRKEGLTALTALTVAGEFHASLPSPEWVVQRYVTKGAPVGYHCPEPVPVTLSQIAILDKAPHKNAARLFVNWMVSREGQITQYSSTFAVPVHKDLQLPQFVPFSDTIIGKKANVRDDVLLTSDTNKKMGEEWDGFWGKPADSKK